MANLDSFSREDRSDPNRDDIPAGILRQRRNLFVVSFILFAINFAGLKFQFSSIEIFGITATLQRPEIVEDFLFLWTIWAYFLVRYVQYLSFYKSNSDLENAWIPTLQALYTRVFSDQILKKFPELRGLDRKYQVFPSRVTHSIKGSFHVEHGTIDGRYDERKYVTELSYLKVLFIKLIAALRLVITSGHFSDYYLPFIVALVPCIQAVF